MLTVWIIGSIVWILVLFFSYAIFEIGSRADEYEQLNIDMQKIP